MPRFRDFPGVFEWEPGCNALDGFRIGNWLGVYSGLGSGIAGLTGGGTIDSGLACV